MSGRPLRKLALVKSATPAPVANADVRARNWLLHALTASSGAADTISFLALGKVFSAFMTGNVAFLGMRASGAVDAPAVVSLLASLGAFALGSYVASRIVTGHSDIWHRNVTLAPSGPVLPRNAPPGASAGSPQRRCAAAVSGVGSPFGSADPATGGLVPPAGSGSSDE